MNNKRYINICDTRYKVKDFDQDEKLKVGTAYVIEEKQLVLPYMGKVDKCEHIPKHEFGIYKVKQEGYKLSIPFKKKLKNNYSVDNIYTLDINYINKVIEVEDLKNDNDILLLEGDVYAPPIEPSDNILQKIIKDVLQRKQVDLRAYNARFPKVSEITNFKRSLVKHGMTVDKFLRWCAILDIDFEIVYKDKPGCLNPMGYDYIGSSTEIDKIESGSLININTDEYDDDDEDEDF